jgi:serine/threonine protein kinase
VQGSLREAFDRQLLSGVNGWPLPAVVLSLAHDVASALLHLHEQGIVHGDIKAANVLLTGVGMEELSGGSVVQWRHVTAKVADFGLALLLGPADTHATHKSRVSPGARVCIEVTLASCISCFSSTSTVSTLGNVLVLVSSSLLWSCPVLCCEAELSRNDIF